MKVKIEKALRLLGNAAFSVSVVVAFGLVAGCASKGIRVSVDTEPYRQAMIDACKAEDPANNYCNLSVDRYIDLVQRQSMVSRLAADGYRECLQKFEEDEARTACYEPHYREAWQTVVEMYSS